MSLKAFACGFTMLVLTSFTCPMIEAHTLNIPVHFESSGADRIAIEVLLTAYSRAVSTKDEALFETLLLNKNISFSDVSSAVQANGTYGGTQNFRMFRKGVFKGPPFTQHLRDVHILQDGMLATVSLVFVNASAGGASWGWKSMQLLKVAGRWKIASEFYTGHGS